MTASGRASDRLGLDEFERRVAAVLEMVGDRRVPVEPGRPEPRTVPRNEHDLEARTHAATLRLSEWIDTFRDLPDVARRFDDLRRAVDDLYDRTLAYVTVAALTGAARSCLESLLSDRRRGETPVLRAIGELFAVVGHDTRVFQAINRCDGGGTASGARKALASVARAGELLRGVEGDLAAELRGEVRVLRAYYEGIRGAAVALVEHERSVSEQYRTGTARALEPDSESCAAAARYVRDCIREIEVRPEDGTEAHTGDGADRRTVALRCASRLSAWVQVLDATAATFADPIPGLRPSSVRLVYCYPFALELDAARQAALRDGLRRVARAGSDDGGPGPLRDLVAALDQRWGSTETRLTRLTASELWSGAGDVVYNGATIQVGTLEKLVETGPDGSGSAPVEELEAAIKLSLLGNHCLCVTVADVAPGHPPTPTELFRALRAGADYAGDLEYRYRLRGRGRPGAPEAGHRWRNVHGFACDVLQAAAEALSGKPERDAGGDAGEGSQPRYKRGDVHVIGVMTTDEPFGDDAAEIGRTLDGCYGGALFRANTHRVAAALHDWIRYPIGEDAVIAVPAIGFRGDWFAATGDATLFGVAGNPSWKTEAYIEATQFAAACSAQLLLWHREVFYALEAGGGYDSDHLRQLQLDAQRFTTAIAAEALCWSRTHRQLLDRLLTTTRAETIADELDKRLSAVELARDKLEHSERHRTDDARNWLLAVIALFGIFNLSSFLSLKGRADFDTDWKIEVAAGLVVVVLALFASRGLIRWWWHRLRHARIWRAR